MSKNIKLGVAALAASVALGVAAPSWAEDAATEDAGTIEVTNCGKATLDIALLVPNDSLSGRLEPKDYKEGETFKAKLDFSHHPLFIGVSHVKPRVFFGVQAGTYGAAAAEIEGKWRIALEKSEGGTCPEFTEESYKKHPMNHHKPGKEREDKGQPQ
ncbi:MAG: hypothetical protein VYC38_01400 [Pseudomonadota bacterium]|nr:hypothetical protein [Pseudomonadota bacterium]